MVFGGAPILDATHNQERTIGIPGWVTSAFDGRCFGGAEGGRARGPWGQGPGRGDFDFEGLRSRNLTAWHYGAGHATAGFLVRF